MPKPKPDKAREQRIAVEIIADCHDEAEQMMGWYNYLEEQLRFPYHRALYCETRNLAVAREG